VIDWREIHEETMDVGESPELAEVELSVKNCWLLPKFNGQQMNKDDLRKIFLGIFYPHNISTQMLRKMFVSHAVSQNVSVDVRKTMARTMGHSIATQELTYTRLKQLV
jgi:hypothetical protein